MEQLQYFDCNAFIGKIGYKHPQQIWQTEDILVEMDRSGIAGALVYHGLAMSHSPVYGNRLLEDELQKSPRLFGCWVLTTDHLGDFPVPEQMIELMKQKNIGAAKIFPKLHRYEPNKRTFGRQLAALEDARIPLLIHANEIEFRQLAELLELHPDLKVILQSLSWSFERQLFPLMDEFPGLCTEFSGLQSNRILEIAYERYGAERLLFGSAMPARSPGAARSFLDYSDIPMEARQLIAGGNLSRLLGGVIPPTAVVPDQDVVALNASLGQKLSIPILDSHTHLIEDGGATGSGFPMLHGDIDSMIEMYRRIGISKMSIAPWLGICADSEAGNWIAEKAIQRYPNEVVGYVTIDPNYVADVEGTARFWHVEKGFKGIKPYYYTSMVDYTDPIYEPWWQLGNEKRLYALVDPGKLSDGEYVRQIETLAQRYPEVNIFMDHAGRTFEIAQLYAGIAKKYDNVTLQLTYTTVTLGVIEYLIEEVGASKILFGTDSPMRDPRPQVGWLAFTNLSLEDKQAIFGGNFQRILDRCLV